MTLKTSIDALPPVHPGDLLRLDILPELAKAGIKKAEVARRLGVARHTFLNVVDGRSAVSPAMALRLGALFGNSPQFWLNLQNLHDLKLAQAELKDDLAAIDPLKGEFGLPAPT